MLPGEALGRKIETGTRLVFEIWWTGFTWQKLAPSPFRILVGVIDGMVAHEGVFVGVVVGAVEAIAVGIVVADEAAVGLVGGPVAEVIE